MKALANALLERLTLTGAEIDAVIVDTLMLEDLAASLRREAPSGATVISGLDNAHIFPAAAGSGIKSYPMITIGNVAAALDDAREHALPGRAVVAANEVWRRLRDLSLKRDPDDRLDGRTTAAGDGDSQPNPSRATR